MTDCFQKFVNKSAEAFVLCPCCTSAFKTINTGNFINSFYPIHFVFGYFWLEVLQHDIMKFLMKRDLIQVSTCWSQFIGFCTAWQHVAKGPNAIMQFCFCVSLLGTCTVCKVDCLRLPGTSRIIPDSNGITHLNKY